MGNYASTPVRALKSQGKYPRIRRDESVLESYHGHQILDPYRWLEDPDSEETRKFVLDQKQVFDQYFADCQKDYEFIKQKMTRLYEFERRSTPTPRRGKYLFSKNTGLQNQDVVYLTRDVFGDKNGVVLIDPNQWSSDGTIALAGMSCSRDASLIAYSSSEAGSDWNTVRFMSFDEKRRKLADKLEHVKFSCFEWLADGRGGFYNTFDCEKNADGREMTENKFCKTMFHRLGDDQCEDRLILHFPDKPGLNAGIHATRDGRYLVCSLRFGCQTENAVWIAKLDGQISEDEQLTNIEWQKLLDNHDAAYMMIENKENLFYFLTNCDQANRFKVIVIDVDNPGKDQWRTLIEEDETDIIEDCVCAHQNYLILNKIHHVKNVLSIHRMDDGTKIAEFNDSQLGAVSVQSIRCSIDEHELFFSTSSFTSPLKIYMVDLAKSVDTLNVFHETTFKGLDVSNVECQQVFYASSVDPEVKIPMYIIKSKDVPKDGTAPTYLYGYGGFGVNLMPSFSLFRLLWICDYGGILAIPNIRGGCEYGEQWHKDGQKLKKMNCFNDFCDAAHYLIDDNFTSSEKLAIHGASNGGLLAAACANLKPSLFRMAIPEVGVLDMLRFHKWTIGIAWTSDYGCSDNKEDCEYLLKYSPLHNIPKDLDPLKQFPSILCITADHDDRVVPAHTFKYIAQLQYAIGSRESQTNPLLVHIEIRAGHGQGKPIAKQIALKSMMLATMVKELGVRKRSPNEQQQQ